MRRATYCIGFMLGLLTNNLFAVSASQESSLSHQRSEIQQFENGLIDLMKRGSDNPELWTIEDRLAAHEVPGVAVAIIQKGKVILAKGYGTVLAGSKDAVNADTLFSVGSVSKLVNAALVLRLVADGKVHLDRDVNTYLTSWRIPKNRYTNAQYVTLRQILAHTAGFNVHGFEDYAPEDKVPSIVQILNGEPPAKNDPIRLISKPGRRMRYSGGGVTVSQLLVEDVTGLRYSDAAQEYVFEPLGMDRSTFVNPLPEDHSNVAKSHDEYGRPAALPRGWETMPELAASGLWTNVHDLSRFIIALMESLDGGDEFLPKPIAVEMMTRIKNSWHGLGPRLNGRAETRVFHHGGANNNYRAWVEGHPHTKSGIVILTNGADGHWIHMEIRKAVADAFGWPIKSDGGFEEPELL